MRKKYLNLAKSEERKNIKSNKEIFGREIESIAEALNLEEELLTAYYVWYKLEGQLCKKFYPMSISIIFKNINYLYSSYRLTYMGQYAAARVIFRNVYESLIILKAISITEDDSLMNEWLDGKDINMRRRIFQNVTEPNSLPMKRYWEDLCKLCHGTIESNQYSLEFNYRENMANFVLIEMLLEMNYHVLKEYVTGKGDLAYISRLMGKESGDITLVQKEKNLLKLFKERRKNWGKESQEIMNDFTIEWKFTK